MPTYLLVLENLQNYFEASKVSRNLWKDLEILKLSIIIFRPEFQPRVERFRNSEVINHIQACDSATKFVQNS
jgi:hypothetical protein